MSLSVGGVCVCGGEQRSGTVKSIDSGLESVGFNVWSLRSVAPTICRDCGLSTHACRHTLTHAQLEF